MHSALRLIWLLATLHQLCWKTFLLCYTTTSKVHHFVLLMLFTAFYELWHRLTYRLWSEWLVDFRFISSRLSVFDEPKNRTLKSSLWLLSTRFCRLRWSKVSTLNHEWSVAKSNLHRPLSVPKKNAKNQSTATRRRWKINDELKSANVETMAQTKNDSWFGQNCDKRVVKVINNFNEKLTLPFAHLHIVCNACARTFHLQFFEVMKGSRCVYRAHKGNNTFSMQVAARQQ